MAKSNVVEFAGRDKIVDPLTDLLRTGVVSRIISPGISRFML